MTLIRLLVVGLCALFGTLSTTESATVPSRTTKESHGPATTASHTTTEVNTTEQNDNTIAEVAIADVAVTSHHDIDATTESSITSHETNSTTFEWTNTTIDTNATADVSRNTTTGISTSETSNLHNATRTVETVAGRSDIANVKSTPPSGPAAVTGRAVSPPPTIEGLIDNNQSHHQ